MARPGLLGVGRTGWGRVVSHGAEQPRHPDGAPAEATTGQLASQLSQEVSRLVRDEFRLAQLEVSGKAKKAGAGAGLLGAAGLTALYGAGVLIVTAILALALIMAAWLAALLVGVALVAAGGIAALLGRRRLAEAGSPVPGRTIESVKRDVEAVRHPGEH